MPVIEHAVPTVSLVSSIIADGESARTQGMTRREFLKLISSAGAWTGVATGIPCFSRLDEASHLVESVNFPPHFQSFRRVVVTQGIKQISDDTTDPKQLALVYPNGHIHGIRDFLEKPKLHEVAFSLADSIPMPDEFKDSLFSIRKYGVRDQRWKLLSSKRITS